MQSLPEVSPLCGRWELPQGGAAAVTSDSANGKGGAHVIDKVAGRKAAKLEVPRFVCSKSYFNIHIDVSLS